MRIRVLISTCAGAALLAFVPAAPAAPVQGCVAKILREWRTGVISRKYAPSCYRTALANLPEDMRIYSSAQDDIARALQARLMALVHKKRRVLAAHKARLTAPVHKKGRVLAAPAQKPTSGTNERAALGVIGTSAADDTLPIPVVIAGAAAMLLVGLAAASRLSRRLRR